MQRTDRSRIHDHAGKVDPLDAAEFVQQQAMQFLPHAGLHPLVQTIPQSHAAATHLLGKIFPGDAALEHEENAAETQSIGLTRLAPFEGRWMGRQDWFHQFPQFVGHQQLAHDVLHDKDAHYHGRRPKDVGMAIFRSS